MTIKVLTKEDIPRTLHGKTSYARETLDDFIEAGADAAEVTDWDDHYVSRFSLVACMNGIITRDPSNYGGVYAMMRNGRVFLVRNGVRDEINNE